MRKGKGSRRSSNGGLLPNSLKIISSCLKTVSTNASTVVRSAGATVAASIAATPEVEKDQVLWAGFDKLELSPTTFRHILLLGYSNGFQVVDVEDASNYRELVSKRDGRVTFLQMQPIPINPEAREGFGEFHPLLLVVAGDEADGSDMVRGSHLNGLTRNATSEPQLGNSISMPTVVRFYSLKSDNYVHVLRFRSAVRLIRCSPRIIAVALTSQIYCFDAVTLENKFSVLTYPIPHGGEGFMGVNIGYGPMAVGPRWLAYASNSPLLFNTGRLSPQNLTPSPGVSPSTSPSSGSLVARYAVESSKQFAAGIINLGDMGYKTLSKYCQELLPDGSNSPIPSNASWKVSRVTSAVHPSETDNAGMVLVKDFVSKEIISQFRAHTSPISALCFDPSGTLLVTASVHGNNINVFRIMPSSLQNGSNSGHYDWSSSHVHLYKLYRGLTTAVIQDICFSHSSHWIAIISLRGTCHIFVLSPFGGDVVLQSQSSHSDGPILLPSLSLPWWSTPTYTTSQQLRSPPPPSTLSVVGRMKNGSGGWLNTVSNAAALAAGKLPVPSGAVTAVFHNSIHQSSHSVHSLAKSLEHLLVYSPSGHVIQHELLLSAGVETCESNSQTGPGPYMPIQEEELWVKAEPVQWWDVCRRLNWPEREENISSVTSDRLQTPEMSVDSSDFEDNVAKSSKAINNTIAGKDAAKIHERSHWYLSNAEVQISTGRIPLWQKSKICFYTLMPLNVHERKFSNDRSDGEIELEKLSVLEVEIKRKDLVPVFEHLQSVQPDRKDRGLVGVRYPCATSLDCYQTKDKFTEDMVMRCALSASSGSMERSYVAHPTENLLDLDDTNVTGSCRPIEVPSMVKQTQGSVQGSIIMNHHHLDTSSRTHCEDSDHDCMPFLSGISKLGNGCGINGMSPLEGNSPCVGRQVAKDTLSSNNAASNELTNASGLHQSPSSPNMNAESGHVNMHNTVDFAKYFHEGYCNVSELNDCRELTEVVTDADSSSSHCERDKPEEDGDNDDLLGGMFAFSEEG